MSQLREIAYFRWDLRVVEVIIGEVKPLQVNKPKKTAARAQRTIEAAVVEIKANDMARFLITLNSIP